MSQIRNTYSRRTKNSDVCPLCSQTGNIGQMLLCIKCQQWWHFNCVINTSNNVINPQRWCCPKCADVDVSDAYPQQISRPHTVNTIQSDDRNINLLPSRNLHAPYRNISDVLPLQNSRPHSVNSNQFNNKTSNIMSCPTQTTEIDERLENNNSHHQSYSVSHHSTNYSEISHSSLAAINRILKMNEQCLSVIQQDQESRARMQSSNHSQSERSHSSYHSQRTQRTRNWVLDHSNHSSEPNHNCAINMTRQELTSHQNVTKDQQQEPNSCSTNLPASELQSSTDRRNQQELDRPEITSTSAVYHHDNESNFESCYNFQSESIPHIQLNKHNQPMSNPLNLAFEVKNSRIPQQQQSKKVYDNPNIIQSTAQYHHNFNSQYMQKNFPENVRLPFNKPNQDRHTMIRNAVEPNFREPVNHVESSVESHLINLLSRQSLQDLPCFDGNFEEWMTFISVYNSTKKYFSDIENHNRLIKSLSGEAKQTVKALLINSNNLNEIIEILQFRYGRSEQIIRTLINKVRKYPTVKDFQWRELVNYSIEVRNLCSTIVACNSEMYLINTLLIDELASKLSGGKQAAWEKYKLSNLKEHANLNDFSIWLHNEVQPINNLLDKTHFQQSTNDSKKSSKQKEKSHLNVHMKNDDKKIKSCVFCSKNGHTLSICRKFRHETHQSKWKFVKEAELCFNCLEKRHSKGTKCTKEPCGHNGCSIKHHIILHSGTDTSHSLPDTESVCLHDESYCTDKPSDIPNLELNNSASIINYHDKAIEQQKTLFKIIPITIHGPSTKLNTYAFLDDGSNTTLIDKDLAKELNIRGTPDPLCLHWTTGVIKEEVESEIVKFGISSIASNGRIYHIKDVRTIENLGLPTQNFSINDLKSHFSHLKQVNVSDQINAIPKVLIGLDNAKLSVPTKVLSGATGPVATNTKLGWVIHGSTTRTVQKTSFNYSFNICSCNSDDLLHKVVKHYFTTESFGVNPLIRTTESNEDARARSLLEKTTTLLLTNRYQTGLIWKYDNIILPDSYGMALKRLTCVENKLAKDDDLRLKYQNNLMQMIEDGFARKLTKEEIQIETPKTWYLPHFNVTNPKKPNKFRIVFDAAAKVQNVSLNDALLAGPDMLTTLIKCLYGMRERRIAFCADIEKMYNQILICPEDQNSQRFLWRDCNKTKPPDIYIMQAMFFGSKSSPCSAQHVKNTNALRFQDSNPLAVQAILNKHYVDDYIDSVNDEDDAIKLASEVKFIHKQGGFNIRNFVSNSSKLQQTLNGYDRAMNEIDLNVEDGVENVEKVLGLWWNTKSDDFMFKLNLSRIHDQVINLQRKPTKREVLKVLMSQFDPFGFLSNIMIIGKILIQDIWRYGTHWDEEIPDHLHQKWITWLSMLKLIQCITIPRYYSPLLLRSSTVQLHIFVDASEAAFAAVAYLRIESNSDVSVAFVSSKNRVAPLKALSVPRMELQAALMGARLADSLHKMHSINFERQVFWCDSQTVLSWIRSDHRNYKQFVAYRVSEILEHSAVNEWNWLPSKENVADEATKIASMTDIQSSSRWLLGPSFLKMAQNCWPQQKLDKQEKCVEELRVHIHHDADLLQPHIFGEISVNKSSWLILQRSVAWLLRACDIWKHVKLRKLDPNIRLPKRSTYLTADELENAEKLLIQKIQYESYPDEMSCLLKKKPIEKRSSLFKLTPYLDSENILRIHGRIDEAPHISANTKRPVILNSKHQITKLILQFYHEQHQHQLHETVINQIRQKFWITGLRTALKHVVNHCQTCKNNKIIPAVPVMSPLPECRLAISKPAFYNTGIDFFGPYYVAVKRSREKRYGMIFTCMTCRAIHLEITDFLTTDSCLLALQRFIARRGKPVNIFSDNGTNLCGANNELQKENLSEDDFKSLAEKTANIKIKWHFNTPASPHHGGAWERLIGVVKKVLDRILMHKVLKPEILHSAMVQVEGILNNRPLTYVPIESSTMEALTPNHLLLVGHSSGDPLVDNTSEDDVLSTKHWRQVEGMAAQFWKRFIVEYLPNLTRRTKWFTPVEPLSLGDIVVVIDPANKRNEWPLGRIVEVYPGKDKQIRSVTVQTGKGMLYKRPVTKIAKLDVMK